MGVSAVQFNEFHERNQQLARFAFDDKVSSERARQLTKGYTAEHDQHHGIEHLLAWAYQYAFANEPVKCAALIRAAAELVTPPATNRPVHTHGTEDGPGLAGNERRVDGRLIGACQPQKDHPGAIARESNRLNALATTNPQDTKERN